MQQSEARVLISGAIRGNIKQQWADLGCGSGMFTKALGSLLPADSHIIAIDQRFQRFDETNIKFHQADFIKDVLPLHLLDGILMANSFHYVADKAALIEKLEGYFADKPRFVFVEYDTTRANQWVPFPISFSELADFFKPRRYEIARLADHPSNFGGTMYAAVVEEK